MWDYELTAAKMPHVVKAETMHAWQNFKLLPSTELDYSELKLRGEILSNANNPIAESTVIINRERFIDVNPQLLGREFQNMILFPSAVNVG